jgi:hypothetical protein
MAATLSTRTLTRLAPIAALLAFGVGLAACGSSPSATPPSTTSTTAAGNSGNTGSTGASSLNSITALASAGKNATFEAVYNQTTSNGSNETITFAQSPPKSLFASGTNGRVINDGTTTYVCGTSSCVASSAAGADPLASLLYLFDGQAFLNSVQAYSVTAAILAAEGITLAYSTHTYAGQSSKCVTVTSSKSGTKAFTWCVAGSGILDYWSSGSQSFTLKSYTSSPPASDFTVPKGYKIVQAPSAAG